MSAVQIEDLKQQITRARERGDTRELQRLQSEYRTHPGVALTAAGRGHRGGTASIRPHVEGNRTETRAPADWPRVTIKRGLLATLDGLFDGAESAGYIFGERTEDAIYITRFVEAQLEDGRTRRSVTLDLERGLQVWAGLDSGATLLGDFHTHPPTGERLWPSAHDVESWEASSQEFKRPWVGLVVREADVRVQGLRGRWQETTQFEAHVTLAVGGRHRWIEAVEI